MSVEAQEAPRVSAGPLITVLALAAVACFAEAITGPFILDDGPLIARNASVQSLGNWREWLVKDFWNVDLAQAQLGDRLRYFRPLVLGSYALDWRLGGGAPWVLHVTNVLLHVGVAWLAFSTLRRWMGALVPAFVAALLFTVHPTKAESVAWISGRPDVLVTAGILLASLGMARRLRRESGGVPLELAGTALAYLSKEHAIVLPALAFVESWVAAGRPPLDTGALRRGLRAALPQLAVAAIYLAVRQLWLPLRQFEISGLSNTTHVALVVETLGRLGELAVWPADLSMTQAMIRTGADGPRPSVAHVVMGIGMLLALGAVIVTAHRRRPALALGAALWLGTLLPVSNAIWSGLPNLTSSRFLYLPSLGLAWCAGELIVWAWQRGWIKLATLAATTLTVALGARSVARTADFTTTTAFWSYELSQHPTHVLGHVFAVDHARSHDRPRQALQLAAHGFEITAADFSHDAQRSTLVLEALELATALTPDVRRGDLQALDAFITALAGGEPARLLASGIALDIPARSRVRQHLARRQAELLLIQADIATRLGDDPRGLTLARGAVESCPRCAAEWESAAKIALRTGEHEAARAWFQGPRQRPWSELPESVRGLSDAARELDAQLGKAEGSARVQLQARRQLLLGLPGRAYATLAPHRDAITGSGPQAALALAEVAARAGATEDARAILAPIHGVASERLLATWDTTMGWRDAEITADDDLTFERTLRDLVEPGRS